MEPHVVQVSGAVSGARGREVRRAVTSADVHAGGEIVIDLTEVTTIDGVGMQEIGLAASLARLRGCKVRVQGGSPSVRERLLLAGIDSALP